MSNEYRLCYMGLDAPEKQYLEAYAVPYGPEEPLPQEQRYFYAVRGKKDARRRVCFIKLQNGEKDIDKRRAESEWMGCRVSSPYVVAHFHPGEKLSLEMQRKNENGWVTLPGRVVLLEYLPADLERFWKEQVRNVGPDHLDRSRGQILIKLIEAEGHLLQRQVAHRDIKPQNIMINSYGLCDEAKWCCEELDVKLTDFDSAQNEHALGTQFYTKSCPYQPAWRHTPNAWLDLYSICMVALWLYCGEDAGNLEVLRRLSDQQCGSEEEIYAVLRDGAFPEAFLRLLVPSIFRAVQGMSGRLSYKMSAKDLAGLSNRLLEYYFHSENAKPMELLEPSKRQRGWGVILQVDQDFWPVFGLGREYRILSFAGSAMDPEERPPFGEGWQSEIHSERVTAESGLGGRVLSAPPEIWVSYEGQSYSQNLASVKVGIYGSVQQEDGQTFKVQRLAERRGILRGENTPVYQEKEPIRTWERERFFHTVHVHSVDFYEDTLPPPLPVYSGPQAYRGEGVEEVNVVLILPVSGRQNFRSPSSRFVMQVVNQGMALRGYRPCYYGLTVLQEGQGTDYISFCNGKWSIPGEDAMRDFHMTSGGRMYQEEKNWVQSGEDHLAFSQERLTAALCFLDRPLDPKELADIERALNEMSGTSLYAVDHLQVFLPARKTEQEALAWESKWEPMLRLLHGAVRPEGAFVVTPLDNGLLDREVRWPKDLRWCGRHTGQEGGEGPYGV